MAEVLEERASEEVMKRDEAIESLQKELDRVAFASSGRQLMI